jgi:uncharacterized protein (UPF0548 family)
VTTTTSRPGRPLLPRLSFGSVDRAARRELEHAGARGFNYQQVGASRDETVPPGCDRVSESAVVGTGMSHFSLLAEGIRDWEIHRRSGLHVLASGPAREGGNVAIAQRFGPAAVVLSCRVVWTLDEPRRNGFGYGSLTGHPEAGEEAFLAELDPDGAVRFRVFGFTSAGTVATALARPLTRALTRRALVSYLRAARGIVSR